MKMMDEDFADFVDPLETIDPQTDNSQALAKLAAQIMASSDPSKWTGEGHGSAQANANDMARVLLNSGISDLSQLGQRTVEAPDVQWVGSTEDGGYEVVGTAPKIEYYNKATDKPIDAQYNRAGSYNANRGIFSGTFAGNDATDYLVDFDAQGAPHLSTQQSYGTGDQNLLKAAAVLWGLPMAAEYLAGAELAAPEAMGPSMADASTTLADLNLSSVPAAAPAAEVPWDFPELDMPEVPSAPEVAAPPEVKFDYPELDMPEVDAVPEGPASFDATEFNHEPVVDSSWKPTDFQKLAMLQAAPTALKMVSTPKMPYAASPTYESTNKVNTDIKFDAPVAWKAPSLDQPKLTPTNLPYFRSFESGQDVGPMLDAGTDPYKSALIKSLRDGSATQSFVNPGFVNFATNK